MGDVLVTGGTGGLGAELVPRLLDAGHTVRITSRDAAAAAPEGVTVHAVDLASGTVTVQSDAVVEDAAVAAAVIEAGYEVTR